MYCIRKKNGIYNHNNILYYVRWISEFRNNNTPDIWKHGFDHCGGVRDSYFTNGDDFFSYSLVYSTKRNIFYKYNTFGVIDAGIFMKK